MKKNNTMKKKKVTDFNGTKVLIKNRTVKSRLNEEIKNVCWMDLETARQRLHSFVDKLEKKYGNTD